jgi:RNA-directed DNA polymerase
MRRLPKSFSDETIKRVWHDSRDASSNPGTHGIDRVTAQRFSSSLPRTIARIRPLVARGEYQFAALRGLPLPKSSGGFRIIAIPTVQDRLVQRVLLHYLEHDNRFKADSPISYGFRKGRTLAQAQRRAVELRDQYKWVLKSYIVKFFDRIASRGVV